MSEQQYCPVFYMLTSNNDLFYYIDVVVLLENIPLVNILQKKITSYKITSRNVVAYFLYPH